MEIFEDESESPSNPQNMTLFSSPKTSTQIDNSKKSSSNEFVKMSESPITNQKKRNRDLKETKNDLLRNSPLFKSFEFKAKKEKFNADRLSAEDSCITLNDEDEDDFSQFKKEKLRKLSQINKEDNGQNIEIDSQDELDFGEEDGLARVKQKKSLDGDSKICFNCTHCKKFTCDFYDLDSIRISQKENENSVHNGLSKEIPNQIKSFLDKDERNFLMVLSEINQSMFESNALLKQSISLLNDSCPIIQNSFIDHNGNHCWQYFECKTCSNIIA